jgi:hypothetical protein
MPAGTQLSFHRGGRSYPTEAPITDADVLSAFEGLDRAGLNLVQIADVPGNLALRHLPDPPTISGWDGEALPRPTDGALWRLLHGLMFQADHEAAKHYGVGVVVEPAEGEIPPLSAMPAPEPLDFDQLTERVYATCEKRRRFLDYHYSYDNVNASLLAIAFALFGKAALTWFDSPAFEESSLRWERERLEALG